MNSYFIYQKPNLSIIKNLSMTMSLCHLIYVKSN